MRYVEDRSDARTKLGGFFTLMLVERYAAGWIGISGWCGVAVPGGDGTLLEVDAKGAGDAGVASDRRVEPDRDCPSLIRHVLLAYR